MNNKPLVSVMIPVYNGEQELPLTLRSLVNQSYTNWEAIIVNDGSTDTTKEYLDQLQDSRFIVHHFENNQGRPFARQKALDLASGKYLAMLDADDWYFEDKLEHQVTFLENNPEIALVSGGFILTDKNKKPIVIQKPNADLETGLSIPHASSMLRLDSAKEIKYNKSLLLGQDQDFIRRYIKGKKYDFLASIDYVYNVGYSFSTKKYITTQLHEVNNSNNKLPQRVTSLFKIPIALILDTLNLSSYLITKRGEKIDTNNIKRFNLLKMNLLP
jgi:glycosyltransferase involved in cell wall biosynthesis